VDPVPEEQPEALAKALPAFLHRESHKKWGYKYSAGRNDWTDELRNRHSPAFHPAAGHPGDEQNVQPGEFDDVKAHSVVAYDRIRAIGGAVMPPPPRAERGPGLNLALISWANG
jgi:hypothetical protein